MKSTYWTAALLGLAGLASALSPVEKYGPLSIKNAKLVDSTGTPVTLRGMSLFWHYDLGGKEFFNSSVVKYVQTDWHNSVIRAPIAVENHSIPGGLTAKGYLDSPNDALTKVRTIIDAAIEYGSYVVVDWHTHNAQTASAKEFFTILAKEYGNTPNIIWEIFNEPTDGQALSHANQVIPVIRQHSKNVIVVGSSGWSSNPQEFGTDLDKYPNIAYSMHFYSDHQFWGNVTAAMSKGHAVFATEWGMSSSSGDGGFQSTSSGNIATWLSNLNTNGVSSCNWHLGNAGANGSTEIAQTSAALQIKVGGSPIPYSPSAANPWTDAMLTPAGLSIRSWLRSQNPAWTLSDTALKVTKTLAIVSDKKTDFILQKDTIEFSAAYSKPVKWTLTETGRTSKGSKTTSASTASTAVSVSHVAGAKNLIGSAFQAGETVDVKLEPKGMSATYTLSSVSGVAKRVHETNLRWIGSRLFVPHGLLSAGQRVQVTVRNAVGQAIFQKSAFADAAGGLDLGQRPRSEGLHILDISTDNAMIRSSLAPNF